MNRLTCCLALFIAVTAAPAAAERLEDLGLELTAYSRRLEAHRFVSGRDWDGTVKHFRDRFKGSKTVRWSREVSLPTVKYIHLENLADTGAWRGVNIYQLKNGEVRVYILPRVAPPAAKP